VGEVAVTSDHKRVYDAGEKRCVGVGRCKTLEEMGRRRQDGEPHGKADAVNGETAEPFFEVISLGAKDKVFVAKKRHSDADWS